MMEALKWISLIISIILVQTSCSKHKGWDFNVKSGSLQFQDADASYYFLDYHDSPEFGLYIYQGSWMAYGIDFNEVEKVNTLRFTDRESKIPRIVDVGQYGIWIIDRDGSYQLDFEDRETVNGFFSNRLFSIASRSRPNNRPEWEALFFDIKKISD